MTTEEPTTTEPEPAIPEEYAKSKVGDVIWAWQMQVEGGWNIIGLQLSSGHTMPLVTTSMPLAWEAFEVAQAHANANQCQVRLAAFGFDTLAAVMDPND